MIMSEHMFPANPTPEFMLLMTSHQSTLYAAIAALLAIPGASRFLLEARVPYGTAALDEFLGARPEQYCSDRTARAMAMAERAGSRPPTRSRRP